MLIFDPHNTGTSTNIMHQYVSLKGANQGAPEGGSGGICRIANESTAGVALFSGSGNLKSGKITAYGITNS